MFGIILAATAAQLTLGGLSEAFPQWVENGPALDREDVELDKSKCPLPSSPLVRGEG